MYSVIISALVLGFAGGISPGPLTAFAISRTITHGKRDGYLVAIVPLITDFPIVIISIVSMDMLSDAKFFYGIISLLGAAFLIYLAYETYTNELSLNENKVTDSTLIKGIITNYLNPHPYLFWFTVGAPTILNYGNNNISYAIFFLLFFYTGLIGAKFIVVAMTSKSTEIISSKYLRMVSKSLALLLLLFSFQFIYMALINLNII